MAFNWTYHKSHREATAKMYGQWVGLCDKDWVPIMDIEDWESAEWGGTYSDTGNMTMVLPGELSDGVRNPVVDYLLTNDLRSLDEPGSQDVLIHSSVHVVVERAYVDPKIKRRCYHSLDLFPEGGWENPTRLEIGGVDTMEHMKHLPCWANPSNRSKVVQLQFQDVQEGAAEKVSRKLIGRNLIGYQQPGLLSGMFSWTNSYTDPAQWTNFNPAMNPVVCSPRMSGVRSEWTTIAARWDNAWDLLKATWDAAGVMPITWLWWPEDPQPFPEYTTLVLPTVVIDFVPKTTITGGAGLLGQGLRALQRMINPDDHFSSVIAFDDASTPTLDGRKPWVVYAFQDAPKIHIRKSTDHRFLVGGKSPDLVNKLVKVGIKSAVAALVASIPGIGAALAEGIKGAGEMAAELSADKLLVLQEFVDKNREFHHGRSGYKSISMPGEANTTDALQKGWSAKEQTGGGISIEFQLDNPEPYAPGRDFGMGDTIGVTAWGAVWASYVSMWAWTSDPAVPVGDKIGLGNLADLGDVSALFAQNIANIEARWRRYMVTRTS